MEKWWQYLAQKIQAIDFDLKHEVDLHVAAKLFAISIDRLQQSYDFESVQINQDGSSHTAEKAMLTMVQRSLTFFNTQDRYFAIEQAKHAMMPFSAEFNENTQEALSVLLEKHGVHGFDLAQIIERCESIEELEEVLRQHHPILPDAVSTLCHCILRGATTQSERLTAGMVFQELYNKTPHGLQLGAVRGVATDRARATFALIKSWYKANRSLDGQENSFTRSINGLNHRIDESNVTSIDLMYGSLSTIKGSTDQLIENKFIS
ncbi:MAG: hypothetical protein ABJO30_05535 [Hyphomicrobiales bacterium]